ncbi:unnamed protein product [Calypogeia fissa]
MAPQSLLSTNMLGMMTTMVLALLSMKAVSAGTTYAVKWTVPLSLEGLHQGAAFPKIRATTLKVGDSLRFEYDSMRNDLLEVDEIHFEECNNSAPIQKFIDGDTTITFSQPGEFYYICGLPRCCLAGQFLIVMVESEAGNVALEPTSAVEAPIESLIESSDSSRVESPIESPMAARNEIAGQPESSNSLEVQPTAWRWCFDHYVHNCPQNKDKWSDKSGDHSTDKSQE